MAAPIESNCTKIAYLLSGFVQLVVSFIIAVLASMIAATLLEYVTRDQEYRYLPWYGLAVDVILISVMHYVLALLFMWGTYKSSPEVLEVWESATIVTCAMQMLCMVVLLGVVLREAWQCETRPWLGELTAAWRGALGLHRLQAPSSVCMLNGLFGKCVLTLGVAWCFIICMNCYYLTLIQDKIDGLTLRDKQIENRSVKKSTAGTTHRCRCRSTVDVSRNTYRCNRESVQDHMDSYFNHSQMEAHKVNNLYPYSDLYGIVADEMAARYGFLGSVPGSIPRPAFSQANLEQQPLTRL